jgi:glycosyltransferase involved in cell wall biosynthesis
VQKVLPQARIVKSDKRGPGAARNAGVSASNGEWIAFLDADDVWLPDKTRRQAESISRYPDAGVILSAFVDFDSGGPISIRPLSRAFKYGNALLPVLLEDIAQVSCALCARWAIERVGGWPEVEQFEDTLFFGRLTTVAKFVLIDEVLMLYRRHSSNRSSSHPQRRLEATRRAKDDVLGRIGKLSLVTRAKLLCHSRRLEGYWHLSAGRTIAASGAALRAIMAWPPSLRAYVLLLSCVFPNIQQLKRHVRGKVLIDRRLAATVQRVAKDSFIQRPEDAAK